MYMNIQIKHVGVFVKKVSKQEFGDMVSWEFAYHDFVKYSIGTSMMTDILVIQPCL